jgi:hypothetical protein
VNVRSGCNIQSCCLFLSCCVFRLQAATSVAELAHARSVCDKAGCGTPASESSKMTTYRILCIGCAAAGARRRSSRRTACSGCGGAHARRRSSPRSLYSGWVAGRAGNSTCAASRRAPSRRYRPPLRPELSSGPLPSAPGWSGLKTRIKKKTKRSLA